MLLCTVRDCHRELARPDSKHLVCSKGHAFDVARSGYINLLQPQDSRSRQPGDTAAAVAARRRLHDGGLTKSLAVAIAELAGVSSGDQVLDAGCGDGYYLGSIVNGTGCEARGVDISIAAVDAAARRYPQYEWVVANADRFVPWSAASFSLVMSVTARMNSGEFRRVLADHGRLLVAIPAPDDLIELRGTGRDRTARTIEEFSHDFELSDQRRVTSATDLDAAAVEDILLSVYRPLRSEPVTAMRITFSLDLLLFRPRNTPS
jgi:23S rRNA (guanine745-N1)-methyltransferase